MKITDLHIDGFGIWTQLSVDRLPEDAILFYGRNEAGKTTLMQFVRAMLYGFSPARRERYLPPVYGGRPGGTLQLAAEGTTYTVQRYAAQHESADDSTTVDAVGQLIVTAPDGTVEGAPRLEDLLAGIDESIFNNVFAVGLREMQELGTLNDTEAAELLYRLSSGIDRVSLVEVMRELASARAHLLSPDGRPAEIARLLDERRTLAQQQERQLERARRWPALHGQQQLLDAEARELQQGIVRLERQARLVELAAQVRGRWLHRDQLREQLDELHGLPELPDRALVRLDRLKEKAGERRARLADIKQQRLALRKQAAALPLNPALWKERARIEAVGEHAQWIGSLENQTTRLQDEVALLEVEHESHWGELGVEGKGERGGAPDLSRSAVAALREPAKALRVEKRKLEQAQRELNENREQAAELELELESGLSERGVSKLDDALTETGELVARLRRRMQLEQRLEQLHRHRDELEDQSHDLLEGQVLSIRVLAGLGVLFVLGVVLILTGLLGGMFFSLTSVAGWALALLGFGGLAAAIGWKVVLERSAKSRLTTCNRQLGNLAEQIEQAREERDELDVQLPSGGGPLDVRLKRAEEDLKQLEGLLPLASTRKSAAQRADAAQFRIAQAEEALEAAKRRWRDALRSAGLPPNFSPRRVKQAAKTSKNVSDVRTRLSARRQELEERRGDLVAVEARIAQLADDVGLSPESTKAAKLAQSPLPTEPGTMLRRLTAELAVQRGWHDKRTSLVRDERLLKRERTRAVAALKKLLDLRRMLFSQAGVADEAGLRGLARQHEHAARLRDELAIVCEQISLLLATHASEDEIAAVLAENDQQELESRWSALAERLAEQRGLLAELHERRGAVRQEMKSLAENRDLSATRLELGAVDRRLAAAVRRWRTLATMGALLERIRDVYEQERQPQTLCEASRYLEQLTDGRYVRVWTPLEQDVLRVDDRHGQALSVELLSRGTREAVFLALRMALVAQYGERGTVLPVVLDDVLVNFDGERTKAAARVLRDFAREGRQVLLFTCHEHIMKAFKKLKVEIRELPYRELPAQPAVVAEEPEPEELEPLVAGEESIEWQEPPAAVPLVVEPEPVLAVQAGPVQTPAEQPWHVDEEYTFADEEEFTLADDDLWLEPIWDSEAFAIEEGEEDTVFDELDEYDETEYSLAPPDEDVAVAPPLDDSLVYRLAEPETPPAARNVVEQPAEQPVDQQKPLEEPLRHTFRQRPKTRPEPRPVAELSNRFTWESPEMWWREQRNDAA